MLIWGIRWFTTVLGQLLYVCSHCQKSTMHTATVRKGRFTLFFIPIIPIGKQYLITCNLCGLRLKAVDNLRAQLETWEKPENFQNRKAWVSQRRIISDAHRNPPASFSVKSPFQSSFKSPFVSITSRAARFAVNYRYLVHNRTHAMFWNTIRELVCPCNATQ
jgi:zinc-ribbon family